MEIEEKLDSMIKRYEKQNRGLGCLAPLPIVINDLKELKQSLPPKQKELLYWAVMGVTDYFKCDGKIIVFTKEEEAVEVANLIGINTRVEQLERHEYSDCVLIDELRATI